MKWFRKAAEQGFANAQLSLASMYYEGLGVPRSYVMSYMWSALAAVQGNELARTNLNILKTEMTPAQIAEAQRLTDAQPVNP